MIALPALAFRTLLLALYVAATVAASSTHATHHAASFDAETLTPAEKAAYMLPDGSLPVFCAPGSRGDGADALVALHCQGCVLCAAADGPAPLSGFILHVVLSEYPATLTRGFAMNSAPVGPVKTRAPPSV
ncbi:MAG: hypothetical protein AAFW47_01985 [Pseudomonadota bacterium]